MSQASRAEFSESFRGVVDCYQVSIEAFISVNPYRNPIVPPRSLGSIVLSSGIEHFPWLNHSADFI